MPKASLTYHHIKHGGVPMTEAGARRFMESALNDGYPKEEIIRYLKKEGMEQAVLSKGEFSMKEAVAIAEGSRNWCVKNKDKIIEYIDAEMKELQSGCQQETCPLSNLDRGRYEELRKLKEFIEGLQW